MKSIVSYMNQEATKANISNTLGQKTPQFIASVASLVSSNPSVGTCDQRSIVSACLIAASLDLPINQNLGFAYIIPYKQNGQMVAQFQMGYKGYIQLAMRSGQFKTINVTDIRQGEIKGNNRLTGEIQFEWIEEGREQLPIIGYAGYMELINGFSKQLYMTTDQLKKHGSRFSQTFKRGFGLWKDDFDAMATKTVIKMLLSKYAPMTVEMQKAQLADQAIVSEDGEFEYADNEPVDANDVANEAERERVIKFIKEAKKVEDLEKENLVEAVNGQDEEVQKLYSEKLKTLTK